MSLFLEYGRDRTFLIRILMVMVVMFAVTIVLIAFFAVRQRIIYINPSHVIGTTTVGYVPDDAAIYFAQTFITFLGNVNRDTALDQ